jgi:hypothetical protein
MRSAPHRSPSVLLRLSALLGLIGLVASTPAPAAVDPAWERATRASLQALEAHFRTGPDGTAWAPNRTHDLRTTVTTQGFRMVSRKGGAPGFEVGLSLAAFGRDGDLAPVTPGKVSAEGPRATLQRPAPAPVEWFLNDPRGLEHGFTVSRRPPGRAASEVVLALELATDLEVLAAPDQRTLGFARPGESPRLRYSDLVVRDAAGRSLPAHFALAEGRLEIRYDDRGARYPVEVDPIASTAWWYVEATGAFDGLGTSVQTAGDVNGDGFSDILVGIPREDEPSGDAGAVWIYYGSPAGLPSQFSPSWIGMNGLFGANFGHSCAPAGDVNGDGKGDIIVGQPFDILSGQRAFVYMGASGGMRLPSNVPSGGDWKCSGSGSWNFQSQFGWSVGTAGDVNGDGYDDVIVGAPNWSDIQANREQGAVWVWLGRSDFGDVGLGTSDDGTSANAAFSFVGGAASRQAGLAVSTAGDVNADGMDDVLVGAPGWDNNAGRLLLFTGSSTAPVLQAADAIAGPAGSRFGRSVAPAGDVNGDGYADVLVGAPADNGGRGAVYLYIGDPTYPYLGVGRIWTGSVPGDSLGTSVHTAGDVNGDGYADVLVGRGSYTFNGSDPGAAWLFYGGPTGPGTSPDVVFTGETAPVNSSSSFGSSVASAGDVDGDGFGEFIVGSPRYGQSEWGRAYVFKGAALPPKSAVLSAEGGVYDDVVGWSVAIAGDVNNDGYDEVLVGSPHWDGGGGDEGAVFMYYGNSTGVDYYPGWSVIGAAPNAQLGISVAGAGDVNNDGFGDIIAGGHTEGGVGKASAWYGGLSGPPTTPNWFVNGVATNGYFGAWVARAGDVNGDGFSDVIVGASNENAGLGAGQGTARVYLGSGAGLVGTPGATLLGEAAGDQFGAQATTAGDVNADGVDDVIVGAPGAGAGRGRAYVFSGQASPQGVRTSPLWFKDGPSAGSAFGSSVAGAGDVNADGYSDVVIGAPSHASSGRAELYYGGSSGPAQNAGWFHDAGQAFSGYGSSVTSPGDVNGDGYSDLLIGAVFWDGVGGQDCGRAFVYPGGPGGPPSTESWFADGIQAFSNIGHAVAGGGDVNDDGYPDLVMGEPGYSGLDFRTGRAQLFLANGPGVRRTLVQVQNCVSICIYRTVSPQGMAASPGYFPSIRAFSPAGRGAVSAQVEVEPKGLPFDRLGLLTGFVEEYVPGGLFGVGASTSCGSSQNPCHWRIRTVTRSPWFPRSPWFSFPHNAPTESDVRMGTPVLATEPVAAPASLALAPPRPNPTDGRTRLDFDLPRGGTVRLLVQDVSGRRVRTLVEGWRPAGRFQTEWDGRDAAGGACGAGVYFVVIEAAGERATRRLALVR